MFAGHPKAIYYEAHPANFNPNVRRLETIKYIVLHYTGNIGDTALNNAKYFHDNAVLSSAHYFVSDNDIYQAVPENHAAYAVGLGSRNKPWIPNPPMFKVITNNNSISIEMCGSKNKREASNETKETAAKLTVDLLNKFKLTPAAVYRHYDVTGKKCPAWCVDDKMKWLYLRMKIANIFYGEGDGEMLDNDENYQVFKRFMDRYLTERRAMPADWEVPYMHWAQINGLIKDGGAKGFLTRGELAAVLQRMNGQK